MAKKVPTPPDAEATDLVPALTKGQQREIVQAQKALTHDLDEFLSQELGCPPKDFIEDDWRVFEFADANTRAIVDILNDDVVLRVEAPIMRLPTDKALAARLVRELLEFNFFCVGHARVAIAGRDIMAVAMQSATQIGKDDVPSCLRDTATLASALADGLQKRYAPARKPRKTAATKRR